MLQNDNTQVAREGGACNTRMRIAFAGRGTSVTMVTKYYRYRVQV